MDYNPLYWIMQSANVPLRHEKVSRDFWIGIKLTCDYRAVGMFQPDDFIRPETPGPDQYL